MKTTCKICGKEFNKNPCQTKKRYCSIKCKMSDPELHEARAKSMWKGTWKQQKRVAKKNYLASGGKLICHICASTKRVAIHHKDKNRMNNEPSNLEALCNSCHSQFYKHEVQRCPKCKQIISLTKTHTCPTLEQRSERGSRSIRFRERCKACGRMMGEKHVCGPHPKGFKGGHHTEEAKQSIREKNSKNKKNWWKEHKKLD